MRGPDEVLPPAVATRIDAARAIDLDQFGSAAAQEETARIFRPQGATIITHRVVETKEVVTTVPTPRNPEPPTIEADIAWDKF